MASPRKVFVKTDLSTPEVVHSRVDGSVSIAPESLPKNATLVTFVTPTSSTTFDFGRWYGVGVDEITYACHQQILRFLDKQDADVAVTTVITYCQSGLRYFLEYMVALSAALQRDMRLDDVDRNVIDGFIVTLATQSHSRVTQRSRYNNTKSVLKALCMRGLITEVVGGDSATFPPNPFPGAEATVKGEKPLTTVERKAFAAAIREAVLPLFDPGAVVTSDVLAYALLIIALHTGRNTTPLLEMRADALRPHPKAGTWFLVLYKRRGHSTSKVAIREARSDASEIESIPTLRATVASVIKRVIELAKLLAPHAEPAIQSRVWLYRRRTAVRGVGAHGDVAALTELTLAAAIKKLVTRYKLVDADGKPMRLNVSRLRKTFINRIYEILDGDLVTTAAAAGDTVRVTGANYLRPGEDSERNWRFMGQALAKELLTDTIGATEKTPVGGCTDVHAGEFAPKKGSSVCMNFLNCLRCNNYVVTADDLYRLFSFYWRILSERARMDPRRWKSRLAHIVRLIDRDVIHDGLRRGVFTQDLVNRERERARRAPHPFWGSETSISDLITIEAAQ